MDVAEDMKVNGVVITSSPEPIPNADKHMNKPLVPFATATARFRPIYAEKASSKAGNLGPNERSGLRNTAQTASISLSVISGRDK
jgi:hypothetical protein